MSRGEAAKRMTGEEAYGSELDYNNAIRDVSHRRYVLLAANDQRTQSRAGAPYLQRVKLQTQYIVLVVHQASQLQERILGSASNGNTLRRVSHLFGHMSFEQRQEGGEQRQEDDKAGRDIPLSGWA